MVNPPHRSNLLHKIAGKDGITGLETAIVLILFAVSPTLGRTADVYPKNLDIDVLHYVFELTLSDLSLIHI